MIAAAFAFPAMHYRPIDAPFAEDPHIQIEQLHPIYAGGVSVGGSQGCAGSPFVPPLRASSFAD
jgi:hypothetical protein